MLAREEAFRSKDFRLLGSSGHGIAAWPTSIIDGNPFFGALRLPVNRGLPFRGEGSSPQASKERSKRLSTANQAMPLRQR